MSEYDDDEREVGYDDEDAFDLLEEQEGKGFGEDEGEREDAFDDE
jgi:hypothetical protein